MVRFEELQQLWQNQAASAPAAFDARGLSKELRAFGRNQAWINSLKVAILAFAFVRIVTRLHWNLYSIAGVVLVYTGTVTYLVLDWRNQIGISRIDFSAPSMEFVRRAHERLRHQLNPMRRVFWFLILTVGGGANLLVRVPPVGTLAQQVWRHSVATAMPFAAYVLACRIREFRFRRECGAVLERLDALLRAMEQHPS